jgi:SAM-dependent methyltransferase
VTDRTASTAAGTDRARPADSAYSSDRDLVARQSLSQWQTPRHGLPGVVVWQLGGVRGSGRVVDVGCGNGTYVRRLREDRPDRSSLGPDIAPGILATVPDPVAVADITRLPPAARHPAGGTGVGTRRRP